MADGVRSYDVVVVGAGPAGAAAARRARALGLSAAVIDRAVFPRHKLCGALLSGRGQKAMRDVFGLEVDPERFLSSRKVAFKWNGETLAEFDAPYDLTYTYRVDLDHRLLLEAIAAGAEDYQGTRIETFDDTADVLVLSDGTRIGYGVLIGADGAASPVARHIFGRAFDPDRIGFAFEAEVPGGCDADARMSIDFRVVNWGYGWNFPKRETRTIGLGSIKSLDQDLKARMEHYLDLEAGAAGEGVKIKGAHIPLGDYQKVPGRGNVLLAGDAAGLVDGITGEGLAYAMESGAEAAEAAAEVLKAGKPAMATGVYRKRIHYIHAELDKANKLRHFEYSDRFSGLFKDKLANSLTMRQAFFDLLAGETTYGEIEKRISKQLIGKITEKMTGWPSRLAGRLRG
ncbi:NAD(P)/FAD-dependent oxidoreductase [Sinisalibacter lacisalsi]|uniref:FAD/NAD(P)-binding domain-containing protein n=1 Tax=Sinisalibacter lacisalsi TaxID=1526570 RepID=A0ABQ1QT06_9RHOB|nr:geranylgeranyl reductase family protein [Sinisalibacter lacisalsi]GGD44650.1 hypothetical protein GCM10011358_30510 [Sinisalibacter lacisalsi]